MSLYWVSEGVDHEESLRNGDLDFGYKMRNEYLVLSVRYIRDLLLVNLGYLAIIRAEIAAHFSPRAVDELSSMSDLVQAQATADMEEQYQLMQDAEQSWQKLQKVSPVPESVSFEPTNVYLTITHCWNSPINGLIEFYKSIFV